MEKNEAAEGSTRKYSNDTANEVKEPEVLDLRYPKDATKESEDPMDLCVRTKKPEDLDHVNEVETNLEKPTCSKEKSLAPTADFSDASSPPLRAKPDRQHGKKYRCPECLYSTDQRGDLLKHQRTHNGEKPFCCQHCGLRCTQKSNLNKHLKVVHGLEEKQQALPRMLHKCDICDKKFYYKQQLQEHEREHNRVVSYSCPACGREFSRYGFMLRHLNQH